MKKPPPPPLSLRALSKALGEPARWKLLLELAKGDAMPVKELARRCGRSPDMASKHLIVLKEAGLVVRKYNRIYQLADGIRPAPGATHMDLGLCTLKLDRGA